MKPGRRAAARLVALVVFASAMGWLEAVVVVYLREVLGITHREALPAGPEVMDRLRALPWLIPTEQTRELATIVMLAGVAWVAGRSLRERCGAFLITFGVWDIAYYLALYALLRWPPHLATMDVLFLIPPGPWWYQPVWMPIAISIGMIAVGVRLFGRDVSSHGPGAGA